MFRRVLSTAIGVLLGLGLGFVAVRLVQSYGLWPSRPVDKDASYFRDVLQLVHDNYVDAKEADDKKLTRAALDGMLKSLDPHSEFLPEKKYSELEQELSSQFGGIGVQVEMKDSHVTVIAPISGTPGERAGIHRGDQIIGVGGKIFENPSLDRIIDKLRGKPGTSVTVNLRRPEENRIFEVTVKREIIKVVSVKDPHFVEPGVGYVQITSFSDHTAKEFRNALHRLKDEGMTALVLDLRNNPGGVLESAVAVAEPFFKPGELIVYTQGRGTESREDFKAGSKAENLRIPVAVLINSGTASASEIVAGALKDTKRAVLVGETSFGKGLVQSILKLPGGEGLRLTTAKYYTPSGVSIQTKGIEPTIQVAVTEEEEDNLRLQRIRSDIKPGEFRERFGAMPADDRALRSAVEVLRGVLVLNKDSDSTKR